METREGKTKDTAGFLASVTNESSFEWRTKEEKPPENHVIPLTDASIQPRVMGVETKNAVACGEQNDRKD